jgi:hypothetical protein
LLLVCTVNYGQAVRKYSNEFMNIGVDAAALGMANAVTASTSMWIGVLEPCRLTHLEDHQLSLMHANYFANIIRLHRLCKSHWRPQCLGYFANPFWVDDILNTTELIDSQGNIDYNRISLFLRLIMVSRFLMRKLPVPGFQYGVNAKIIRRIIGNLPILGSWIWCRTSEKEWLAIRINGSTSPPPIMYGT